MKKEIRIMKPILVILAVVFTVIILSFPVFAAEPDNPNYWTVGDSTCQSVSVTNGDTTYSTGIVRHCYPPDVEQCNSHSCQSTELE